MVEAPAEVRQAAVLEASPQIAGRVTCSAGLGSYQTYPTMGDFHTAAATHWRRADVLPHGFDMGQIPMTANTLCPIKMIQQARDEAIEAIRAERNPEK